MKYKINNITLHGYIFKIDISNNKLSVWSGYNSIPLKFSLCSARGFIKKRYKQKPNLKYKIEPIL